MLIDSEETATFAYITSQCLETPRIKCPGAYGPWANSTSLLVTAVPCYEERVAGVRTAPPPPAVSSSSSIAAPQWSLKDSEAYLIRRPDAALFVQASRPSNAEPSLLVSLSTIRPDLLYRLYRKGKPGKPRSLTEKKTFDELAESVYVLVSQI